MKNIIVHLGHPAHVHLFKHPVQAWRQEGYKVTVALRIKDQTVALARRYNLDGPIISRFRPGFAGLFELAQQDLHLFYLALRNRGLLIGTSVAIAHIGRLLNLPSIVLVEDDVDVLRRIATLSFPFATAIISPDGVRMARYESKALHYPSYQKLFYLHPDRFLPDPTVRIEMGLSSSDRFGIVRLSALQSQHDEGILGISRDLVVKLIQQMNERKIRVFISSEKPLAPDLAPYRFQLHPDRMHDALSMAAFYVGDSQSMTVEAALLGIPALRLNSFGQRISVINELESHKLVFSFLPGQEANLLRQLNMILEEPDVEKVFQRRRAYLLSSKIDPLPWLLKVVRFIEAGITVKDIRKYLASRGLMPQ
jgi:uncharacterized protein